MNILITGGYGFVGIQLVKDLSEEHDCYILDNEFSGEQRKSLLIGHDYMAINCDIADQEAVSQVFQRHNFDVVIHLAAKHLIPWCDRNNAQAYETNVVGTLNLLNSISEGTKFIFVSSAAVYAASNDSLKEDQSVLAPFDIYGLTKLHGEAVVELKCRQRSINYTIVRLFNVIGALESNSHILPDICYQLRSGAKRIKLGNTDSFRDFIGVKDVSVGLRKIMNIQKNMEIVNLCSGNSHSMNEMIAELKFVSGIEFEIERDPLRQRKSDNPFIRGSTRKLEKLTNWKPDTSFSDNVRSAWEDEWTSENWGTVIK
mgnify:CR=1 FL=1